MMRFHDPMLLLLIGLLPIWWLVMRRVEKIGRSTVRFSDLTHLKQAPRSRSVKWRHIVKLLRLSVLALLIVGLARPQEGLSDKKVRAEGIAIALVIDCSESMAYQDFRPNRLEAAKSVIQDFVDNRQSDEITVVIYGTTSHVACPLTLDYGVLKDFVARLNFTELGKEFISGTAIGLGLANGLRQLEKSDSKSKVVILLSDGRNNAGEITPKKAAELAQTLGIKVYTIGVGTRNRNTGFGAMFGRVEQDLDEPTLKEIAEISGGQYFRASDEQKLKEIYQEIDQLEKHQINITEYDSFDEKMALPVTLALFFLLLEIALAYTRFVKLP